MRIDRNKEAPRRSLQEGYVVESATMGWSKDLGFPLETLLCVKPIPVPQGLAPPRPSPAKAPTTRPRKTTYPIRRRAASTESRATALRTNLYRRKYGGLPSSAHQLPHAPLHASKPSRRGAQPTSCPQTMHTEEKCPPRAMTRLCLATLHGDNEVEEAGGCWLVGWNLGPK
jgi:hypothetical protein